MDERIIDVLESRLSFPRVDVPYFMENVDSVLKDNDIDMYMCNQIRRLGKSGLRNGPLLEKIYELGIYIGARFYKFNKNKNSAEKAEFTKDLADILDDDKIGAVTKPLVQNIFIMDYKRRQAAELVQLPRALLVLSMLKLGFFIGYEASKYEASCSKYEG